MTLWLVAAAMAEECAKTSIGELVSGPSPGVLVLGERKGTWPDLKRAKTLVGKLAARGPVTVAVQSVRLDQQATLDALNAGTMSVEQLPSALDWDNSWGFAFEAYEPLFALAGPGVRFVAIGQPYQPRPADAILPLPPGYIHVLADGMGDSPVPVDLESPLVELVAWADHRLAKSALDAWDHQGMLVVVVDRFHVEGGFGVAWQAQRLTDAPVGAAVLANADSRCYAGDRLLP